MTLSMYLFLLAYTTVIRGCLAFLIAFFDIFRLYNADSQQCLGIPTPRVKREQ